MPADKKRSGFNGNGRLTGNELARQKRNVQQYSGTVAYATIVETNTGTETAKAVTPDGLDGWTGSVQLTTLGTMGGGIQFPTTQVASANVNNLDDYEEGTWTPAEATITLSTANGTYTKIGNKVTARCNVTFPATADATAVTISGLPFSVSADQSARQGFVSYSTKGITFTPLPNNGATTLTFRKNTGALVTNAEMTSGVIYFTLEYYV